MDLKLYLKLYLKFKSFLLYVFLNVPLNLNNLKVPENIY